MTKFTLGSALSTQQNAVCAMLIITIIMTMMIILWCIMCLRLSTSDVRYTMQYFVVLKCHHEKCHNEIIIMQKGFLYAAFHTTDDDVDVGPLD